ncbi:MAG: hypothetical protein ACJAYF_003994 [Arenicella sp.]
MLDGFSLPYSATLLQFEHSPFLLIFDFARHSLYEVIQAVRTTTVAIDSVPAD